MRDNKLEFDIAIEGGVKLMVVEAKKAECRFAKPMLQPESDANLTRMIEVLSAADY